MVECCGRETTTPFCPHCGKRLGRGGPLLDLLQHCRAQEKGFRTRARKHREGDASFFDAAADRWKARGDALVALLDAREEAGDPDAGN